jgi:outer membrane protein OmpA-like peptidoglycan-associated protein
MLIMKYRIVIILFFSYFSIHAQNQNFEAYVFESNNRGYLNQVKVNVYGITNNALYAELVTNEQGYVSASLPVGTRCRVYSRKDIFQERNDTITVSDEKAFLKIELDRKPGYLFDVTLAEVRKNPDQVVDAIEGARLEVYNNTTKKLELLKEALLGPYFQFTFEQGNYYTIMIRKDGYLTRRIEAHVNIDGCIICIDGVSDLRPGITDVLTQGNKMGTLLANIDMQRAKVDESFAYHIEWETNRAIITPAISEELDKIAAMVLANPQYHFELGSYTDSRGTITDNLDLSRRRAEAAEAYLEEKGVERERISSKGYGENYLKNKCKDGVPCTEQEHAVNRRTEMKVLGVFTDAKEFVPLEELIRREQIEKMRNEGSQSETQEYKAPGATDQTLPKSTLPIRVGEKIKE